MKYETPSASAIKEIADELGFTVDDATAEDMRTFWAPFSDAFNQIEETPDDLPPVKYERGAWSRPDRAENPHGGWYVKARIEGAAEGPLKGRTVAIKDSACVAGIPMMNGASVLEGYVPDMDASVVTRLLDAGATILGKSVCEYFCVSGGSNTSASDIAESPRNPGHTPGGSSTGSAALVASGEVDMALGGDQAGSIRIPASMTGIVGIKPTFGLIPYTGIMGIETTVDHTGPMTDNVADNALFLESMAGEDGLDPRQRVPTVDNYTDALGGDVRGMRIAVVSEGFGRYDSLPDVDATVRAAARHLESLGAQVTEVSIPMHVTGLAIWGGICADGMYYTMFRGYGFGKNVGGVYPTSLIDTMARAASRAEEFPHTFRFGLLLGRYTDKAYGGHFPRQVAEPAPGAQGGLRCRARRERPFADADGGDDDVEDPAPRRAVPRNHGPLLGSDRQHRAVQRQRPPGDLDPLRAGRGRQAGRSDARRAAFRGDRALPRGPRLRAVLRLADPGREGVGPRADIVGSERG